MSREIMAWPPGSFAGQNNETLGSCDMFLAAEAPLAHPMTLSQRCTDT